MTTITPLPAPEPPPTTSTAYDLPALALTDIRDPLDPAAATWALSQNPFVSVPGTINFRSWAPASAFVASGTESGVEGTGRHVRRDFVFRSGNLSGITEEGKAKLVRGLGIKKIFDLRVDREVKGSPAPTIEGVEVVWVPEQGKGASRPEPANFAADERKAYLNMYADVLEHYKPSFRNVFQHIISRPSEPFIFHCSAGKDRTGILSILLLSLTHFSPPEIATDYIYTRVGLEPGRAPLLAIMQRDQGFDLEAPGLVELIGVKRENVLAFLEMLEQRYGGAEGYVQGELGFEEEELQRIRKNLMAPVESST